MTTALDHLHKQDICHRDIKSDNGIFFFFFFFFFCYIFSLFIHFFFFSKVMVSIIDGCSRLTDFGFGCQLFEDVDGGKRQSVVGTSFWMAPEGLKGERRDTRKSFLGLTFFLSFH